MSDLVGLHYKLEAFVCGPACIKPSPFDGWATFAQILNARPDGCRFAIAQVVPVYEREPAGDFLVWDLYADSLTDGSGVITRYSGTVTAPPPLWRGDTADGMIMKAMALYERGDRNV